MGSPARRTWTLGTLDRGRVYRLWFDPVQRRWEVAVQAEAQAEGAPAKREPRTARRR